MKNTITIPANTLGLLLSRCTSNQLNPSSTVQITEDETQYKLYTQQPQQPYVLAAYTNKPLSTAEKTG